MIVPTLVSSKYVPTTLGAHKSVSYLLLFFMRAILTYVQLEQTGSTIFQTFAGLFLDRAKKNVQAGNTLSELGAIQRLLGVFLFLNICQFGSILGLWKLDKKRKQQAAELARRAQYQPVNDIEEDLEAECRSSPRAQRNSLLSPKEHVRQESVSLQRRQESSGTIDPPSGFTPGEIEEEEEPLLVDNEPVPWHVTVEEPIAGEAQSRKEHVRGEAFGVISICLIAFAWIFFIITAFLRLRAKSERGTTPS